MAKIQPLADRVLIKPAAAEEKTVGGIIIPDSAKEKPLPSERCVSNCKIRTASLKDKRQKTAAKLLKDKRIKVQNYGKRYYL